MTEWLERNGFIPIPTQSLTDDEIQVLKSIMGEPLEEEGGRVMKSERCKACIHTKVCMKDLNVVGEFFMPGHPMLFDNEKLFKKYEERKKAGFPCKDFIAVADVRENVKGKWIKTVVTTPKGIDFSIPACSECGCVMAMSGWNFCPNCGSYNGGET